MRFLFLLKFLCIISFAFAQTETVFYNARIFTANPSRPYAEALAIRGDQIIAVGKFDQVKSAVGANAVLKDMKGGFIMPGLVDAHMHAISGGKTLSRANLFEQELTPDQLLAFVRKQVKEKKGFTGDVLVVYGVNIGTWTKIAELSRLFNTPEFSQLPLYLEGSDGHTAWANAVMLSRAGIDQSYVGSLPLSLQKYYEKNASGEPNGFITDSGLHKLEAAVPVLPDEDNMGALAAIAHCNSLGITAWLDPSTAKALEINDGILPAYQHLIAQNKLTAHVAATIVADPNRDAQVQISRLKSLQAKYSRSSDLNIIGFKIFADGVLEFPAQTAALSIPYTNSTTNGKLLFDPGKFSSFATLADRQGLLVHVHAIGDLAVTETLNAFETVRKANGNNTVPHSITHLQLVQAKDVPRFQQLNILAAMQLIWAFGDITTVDIVKPYIDPSLYRRQYPAKSMSMAGAIICGASDWPVSSANPFEAMATAETRSGSRGVLDSTERMSRTSMLYAYTLNAAIALLLDQRTGSIQPGKLADLIYVDRDLSTVGPEELRQAKVLWTMFKGKIVYEAGKK